MLYPLSYGRKSLYRKHFCFFPSPPFLPVQPPQSRQWPGRQTSRPWPPRQALRAVSPRPRIILPRRPLPANPLSGFPNSRTPPACGQEDPRQAALLRAVGGPQRRLGEVSEAERRPARWPQVRGQRRSQPSKDGQLGRGQRRIRRRVGRVRHADPLVGAVPGRAASRRPLQRSYHIAPGRAPDKTALRTFSRPSLATMPTPSTTGRAW
jgi:hypothetical protein